MKRYNQIDDETWLLTTIGEKDLKSMIDNACASWKKRTGRAAKRIILHKSVELPSGVKLERVSDGLHVNKEEFAVQ